MFFVASKIFWLFASPLHLLLILLLAGLILSPRWRLGRALALVAAHRFGPDRVLAGRRSAASPAGGPLPAKIRNHVAAEGHHRARRRGQRADRPRPRPGHAERGRHADDRGRGAGAALSPGAAGLFRRLRRADRQLGQRGEFRPAAVARTRRARKPDAVRGSLAQHFRKRPFHQKTCPAAKRGEMAASDFGLSHAARHRGFPRLRDGPRTPFPSITAPRATPRIFVRPATARPRLPISKWRRGNGSACWPIA